MNIFKSIKLFNSGLICLNCIYFQNDPDFIEESYPGLTVMSSGYASVRDRDGFCNLNQLYLSAGDSCPHFAKHMHESNQDDAGKINLNSGKL